MENKQLKNTEKRSFWKDESGEIGVKQIAVTVGVIVVVAFIVTMLTGGGLLKTWVADIWDYLFNDLIKDGIGGGGGAA